MKIPYIREVKKVVINDGINLNDYDIDSFLMMGQSNMAGRGEFADVSPIKNDLCYMLRMGRWQTMSEPINPDRAIFDSKFHSGISLAASFADCYAKKYKRKVGLIPCADGGTKLSQWMPKEILYEHALMQAKLAMKTSNIKGILWHQGESDCHNIEKVYSYAGEFSKMINTFRNDINLPLIPVIIGEISYNITDKWGFNGNNIIFNEKLPDILITVSSSIIVSSKDLTLKPDGLHFDAVSCREFGNRYFDAYQKVKEEFKL